MTRPSRDPRQYRTPTEPTWSGIIVSTAVMLAIPLLLWIVSHPLAGAAVLTAGAGVVRGGSHAVRLRRCLHECGAFAFDLTDDVRVCVTREGTTSAC